MNANPLPHLGTPVFMGGWNIFHASERFYTFGLCGCTAIVARFEDRILLAHIAPTQFDERFRPLEVVQFLRLSSKSVAFTPGEWERGGAGWRLVPRAIPFQFGETVGYSCLMEIHEKPADRAVWWDGKAAHGFRFSVPL